jgi:hypothetical protein
MKKRIELREASRKRSICETKMRYEVYLDGKFFSDLYFNMRGYVGYLPTPEGLNLDIGERGITAFKKEIASLNKEFGNA